MKSILTSLIVILFLCACSVNKESVVDDLFKEYTGEVPGASLLLIKNDKKILEKSYGLADKENNIKVTPQTNFRLASVTKQFTAMCVLQLIEKGNITLQTSLTDIFNEFPEYGKAITIKHLLQHTSGLIDYEDLMSKTDTSQILDADILKLMKQVDSTYFEPGSSFKYSNSAYAVLAMIIENISGISFANYLEQHIFKPIGMSNTIAFEKDISTVNYRAFGYAFENGKFVFKDQSTTSAVLGDGGIYSSIADLFKWDQILYTDQIISTKTLDLAFSKGPVSDVDSAYYGYGWYVKEYNEKKCVFHTGSSCGFRNIIFRIPEQEFSIIILTNRDEPDLKNMAKKIMELYL